MHIQAILLSIILGTIYYQIMESSIPTESNCSYMAAPVTDLLAFIWGAIVVYYGFEYDNIILTTLGSTVIVEHIYQLRRK
tara:strand:+ start:75 stop:314 length:240 start_codon:yes stop_codon:yes gene_type:complete